MSPDASLRNYVFGLLMECPNANGNINDRNPKDCPLHDIRKLKIEDRLAWVDAQTNEQLGKIISSHKNRTHCSVEKHPTYFP